MISFISDFTRFIGVSIKRLIEKSNPQSVAFGAITLLLAFVSTAFTVLSYYKNYESPRSELAARGIPWQQNNFFEAIRVGDIETLTLFLEGGMNPNVSGADRQLPMFLADNKTNSKVVFDLLRKHGLNVNGSFPGSNGNNYLLFWAIFDENVSLVHALLEGNANADIEFSSQRSAEWLRESPLTEARKKNRIGASKESLEILQMIESKLQVSSLQKP